MQSRLVSKFAFIAWNAFTSNFISASKVEMHRSSLFRDAEPPLKHKNFQEQLFPHFLPGKQRDLSMETEWWDSVSSGRTKAEADEQGVAVW